MWTNGSHHYGFYLKVFSLNAEKTIFLTNTQVQFSSVAQSCHSLRPHEPQHARPPCPSPTSGIYPNWWHPTPVFLPGESHGQRSLVRCSPWGCEESDTSERLHFHFSLSCIGEGNGNPLQCSCLENPRDREAWWAAIYGVTQSWARLKWLSSSSCRHLAHLHLFIVRWTCTSYFNTNRSCVFF